MKRVLFAMGAVFVQFDTIGIVFLIFITVVVSVFAFCASQNNFYAHFPHLLLCGPGETDEAASFLSEGKSRIPVFFENAVFFNLKSTETRLPTKISMLTVFIISILFPFVKGFSSVIPEFIRRRSCFFIKSLKIGEKI